MFEIGSRKINKNNYPYLIAEIGVNHNGSVYIAKKLIDYAKRAGFDAVKFQTYNLDGLLKKNTPLAKYQKKVSEIKNMYNLLKKYSLSHQEFEKINKYCKKKNITFLSTPFDLESATFLNNINIPAFKISSSDNDNYLLLDLIKKFKKPIILSTGMSSNIEINKTIKHLSLQKNKLALLHCVSDYPTKLSETQLFNILNLKKYGYCYGLSDHSLGIYSSIVALTLGSKIIEKHITLDSNMKGPDHLASLEVSKINDYVKKIKDIHVSLLQKEKFLTQGEILNKNLAKKSLYFKNKLKKNHIITKDDIIVLRPRLNGVTPDNFKKILGKKVAKDIKPLEIISKDKIKN